MLETIKKDIEAIKERLDRLENLQSIHKPPATKTDEELDEMAADIKRWGTAYLANDNKAYSVVSVRKTPKFHNDGRYGVTLRWSSDNEKVKQFSTETERSMFDVKKEPWKLQ